jgi:predicted RNase H-like nuclease (RuvC/YqgF family)
LAAMAAVGFVLLGSYLVQTHQRLKTVEVELGRAKEETVRAKAGAAEFVEAVENLRLELKAANTARDEYQDKLDKANVTIAELSKRLDKVQSDLGKRESQLQATKAELKDAKAATDQAKTEAAEREKQIAKLQQGIASCEEFFNAWELQGAPASLSAIAGLGREAAAAKDCLDKGDVATACKHWQGLLVQIEKMGPPLSESRDDIEELMRQNRCEAEGN